MKIKEQKSYKWYGIKHKGFNSDVRISPLGLCQVNLPNLSQQNNVYFGEIGFRKLREIAEILLKVADIAEEEHNEYTKN